MKNIIKLEEAAMLGLCIYVLSSLNAAWWWYLILIFGPDISMFGYFGGNKIGAACYNLFHHKGIANMLLQIIGIVLFGHSSMDRFFGYGLKTEEGFKYTHLGIIGKK